MPEKRWFWATLTLSSITIVSVVLAAWELVENRLFRDASYITLHYLYVTRGVASSLLLAFWAAWFVLRQRRKSEADLRRSRDLYRGLLEAFPGAVILYDAGLRVLEWNAPAERIYGYGRDEILGARLPILPEAKQAELEDFLGRVRTGAPVLDIETLRLPRGGEPIEVQLSLLPFREGPGPLCFLEVTSDIRERVRWRRQMIEIEKLTSMGKMAAGTAHHLNSPLAALLIRTELIRRHSTGPAFDDDLARIEEGLHFCRHFVQRLLDFTRAMPVQKAPQDLATVIESIAGFFQPAILSRRANLIVEAEEGRGQLVIADRNLLETLLLTLLSNALDAVAAGGEIRLSCQTHADGTVGFTVSDNGSGIGPGQLPHVFEPFFTTKEPGKGTGLGLAIARNIVMEHGGSIEIESRAGEGTAATVKLPLAGVREASRRAAP